MWEKRRLSASLAPTPSLRYFVWGGGAARPDTTLDGGRLPF